MNHDQLLIIVIVLLHTYGDENVTVYLYLQQCVLTVVETMLALTHLCCSRVVFPMRPQELEEQPDVSVLFLKTVLRTAANLIDLLYANHKTIIKVAELIQGLLTSGNNHFSFMEKC